MPVTAAEIALALSQASEEELEKVGGWLAKAIRIALESSDERLQKHQEVLGISEVDTSDLEERLSKLEEAMSKLLEGLSKKTTPVEKAEQKLRRKPPA